MRASARRTYTFLAFVRESLALALRAPAILRARLRRRIDKAFEEQLMLTVTSVNGCRFCRWFHVREALRNNVDAEEIRALLGGVIDREVRAYETPALLYAQHYAESDRKPDPEATARLEETYGREVASEIMLVLQVISVGNLSGNTFSSFLERLRTRRLLERGFLSDLLVFLATAPLFGTIALLMRAEGRQS